MVKAKPIIFNSEMVRAILEGRKTQTRRVVKPQPYHSTLCGSHWYWSGTNQWNGIRVGCSTTKLVSALLKQSVCLAWPYPCCPYGKPGGLLWVRETWGVGAQFDVYKPSAMLPQMKPGKLPAITYKADDPELDFYRWRPSIFMPRWASRITLRIIDVRAERVQDISRDDARDEGYPPDVSGDNAIEWFCQLWDSIVKKAFSWEINPWVWVIEFKVEETNGAS